MINRATSSYCQTNPLENSFYDEAVDILFKTPSCSNQFKINYYYTSMCRVETHVCFSNYFFSKFYN